MSSDDINKLKDAEKEALKIDELKGAPPVATASGSVQAVATHDKDHFALGLILIGVGATFLLTRLTGFTLHNWWALFILLPAVGQLGCAWQAYQKNGRLGRDGRGALTGGLFIALVASAFLFGISWNFIWPFFLILGGISAIIGGWFD